MYPLALATGILFQNTHPILQTMWLLYRGYPYTL